MTLGTQNATDAIMLRKIARAIACAIHACELASGDSCTQLKADLLNSPFEITSARALSVLMRYRALFIRAKRAVMFSMLPGALDPSVQNYVSLTIDTELSGLRRNTAIRKLRKNLQPKMSQSHFAAKVGVTVDTLKSWESMRKLASFTSYKCVFLEFGHEPPIV